MILYVPFTRDQAGDLVVLVEHWKTNHSRQSKQAIHIIYHGDDFDLMDDDDKTEIYVCAHGFSDQYSELVGNYSAILKADLISIQTLANRFNHDFLSIASQISAIHLYCCGSQKKNMEIARQFRANLLRPELPIHSYSGRLTIADLNGTRWSFTEAKATPVETTAHILYPLEKCLDEPTHRMPIKESTKEKSFARDKEKKRDDFFAHQKKARHLVIESRRDEGYSSKSIDDLESAFK